MSRIIKISTIITFLILNSCNLKKSNIDKAEDLKKENDSIYYKYESATIDKIKFEFFIDKNGEFKIKDTSGEIQFSQTENVTDFEIKDFDKDGYKDVIIIHPSNRVLETLLLYNSSLQKFILIDNFTNYPNSQKIESSGFYYSYQGTGCAQNDWLSHLYLINNYKIIDKGLIKGFGCLKNEKNGIYIYKFAEKDTLLIEYVKNEDGFGQEKFDFIDNYWINNLDKFNK
ncbi:hypothetical protein P8625_04365 [Tenacibaculum tangerinum]|uniref:VCBS repeat-containing protein n=1 Tax=Tenacibaculum tangerinum TaxID=3038772 RepID=A0ABY8L549_9FLAO|nr:hypothetical protein [Tenacibaculum tangerinum]WGH76401.1 hypothetical protein P8625_04365 [Tenacibaculum tangerinum]